MADGFTRSSSAGLEDDVQRDYYTNPACPSQANARRQFDVKLTSARTEATYERE